LAHRPALLLADEPTGELDDASADAIRALIVELARANGTSVILVTHDPATAGVADRTLRIRDGRIIGDRLGGGGGARGGGAGAGHGGGRRGAPPRSAHGGGHRAPRPRAAAPGGGDRARGGRRSRPARPGRSRSPAAAAGTLGPGQGRALRRDAHLRARANPAP